MTNKTGFLPGLLGADTPLEIEASAVTNATPGNGPLAGQTQNFDLNLVNFDWVTWHDYEWENWIQVDALIGIAIGFLNVRGFWRPQTDYIVGETVIDPNDVTSYWTCLVAHTSSTDFDVDKPLYWEEKTDVGANVTSVFGRIGDIIAQESDYSSFFYTKAETYTQTEIDASQSLQDDAINSIALNLANNYYTKTEQDATDAAQDAAIAAIAGDLSSNYYTKTESDDNFVNITGDTMTGQLLVESDSFFVQGFGRSNTLMNYLTSNADGSIVGLRINGDTTDAYAFTRGAPNPVANGNTVMTRDNGDFRYTRYAGVWASGTYYAYQIVTHLGSTWLAVGTTTDEPTPSSSDWVPLGSSGGSITIGDTFPTANPAPQNGDLHYKTTGVVGLYVYYDDGDSLQWVQTNGGTGVSENLAVPIGNDMRIQWDGFDQRKFEWYDTATGNVAAEFLYFGTASPASGQSFAIHKYSNDDGSLQNYIDIYDYGTYFGEGITVREDAGQTALQLEQKSGAVAGNYIWGPTYARETGFWEYAWGYEYDGQLRLNKYDGAGNFIKPLLQFYNGGGCELSASLDVTSEDFPHIRMNQPNFTAGISAWSLYAHPTTNDGTDGLRVEWWDNASAYGGAGLRIGTTGIAVDENVRVISMLSTGSAANVYIDGNGYMRERTSLSEYKEAVQPIIDHGVMQLEPVTYRSLHEIDEGKTFAGFIAENVWEAIPEAKEPRSYDTNAIIAHLVAAVQDLTKRIEELENA